MFLLLDSITDDEELMTGLGHFVAFRIGDASGASVIYF